ncbi:hypothetical protein OZD68_06085 [Wolbachia endosymbiont of Drosophila bicornuta]|nr:hypothetical protein [Wolbachia endosymbiont of Drosophila bicornuta]MBA8754889.1 hypothetical protein [Wolbachia pipientis]MDE5057119.1 hypothetical protein [Wolbachia endosymbiont of Drosophila bicornuta]
MLLLYHSHKHISYPIRTIARSAIIICNVHTSSNFTFGGYRLFFYWLRPNNVPCNTSSAIDNWNCSAIG